MEMSTDRPTMAPGNSADGAPLVEQAKQQAGQVVEKTKQAASRVADQAVQQVKTQVESGKERASGSLEDVAQALHATSETLIARNQEMIGGVAETGAELMDQVSEYFRQRSVNEIATDVEGFARRQSGLFLGSAFALGFLLSRFLKSSSPTNAMSGTNVGPRDHGYGHGAGAFSSTSPSYNREVVPAATAMPPSAPPVASSASTRITPPTPGAPAGKSSPASSAEANKGVR